MISSGENPDCGSVGGCGGCNLRLLGWVHAVLLPWVSEKAIIINRLFVNSIVNRWDLELMGGAQM